MQSLPSSYRHIRHTTVQWIEGLSDADLTAQSAEFASPGKWHLAHTTWFFEQFVLQAFDAAYQVFDTRFAFLFNSYYNAVGPRQARAQRGLLTRPSLATVLDYRQHVDRAMQALLATTLPDECVARITLGLHHEQQHQELLLTDLLHLFAQNLLRPAWRAPALTTNANTNAATSTTTPQPLHWISFEGGQVDIGHNGKGFCFDHEQPRHVVFLRPYRLTNRPITNREWLAFMQAGGYSDPALWLSDGWDQVQAQGWNTPLYWKKEGEPAQDGSWQTMTLHGMQPLPLEAPVTHISFFEADAYARWAGKRLPSEFEWEHAASHCSVQGNFVESGFFTPQPTVGNDNSLSQMFGDVWEWTASPFMGYPGFRAAAGAVGEYNGKFMNGQYVLRGGSCVSPRSHLRPEYRNFFQPIQRWQFTGLRLAEDA